MGLSARREPSNLIASGRILATGQAGGLTVLVVVNLLSFTGRGLLRAGRGAVRTTSERRVIWER